MLDDIVAGMTQKENSRSPVVLDSSRATKTKRVTQKPNERQIKSSKGTQRMPWRFEPKKDVVGCDKPGGAVKQALIPGFPNGAIRLESCPVNYS